MKLLKMAAALLAAGVMAGAQASPTVFSEGFDDFSSLAAAGWVLTNSSSPSGQNWFAGNAGVFAAQAGAEGSYAAANFLSTSSDTGAIDNWLISPELTLGSGLLLSFFTQGAADEGFFDLLEIRFSSGSGSDLSGFTTLLATIGDGVSVQYPADGWTQYTLALPDAASGRFAFRYLASDALSANYIGIDSVAVSVPEPGTVALSLLAVAAIGRTTRRRKAAASNPSFA